MLRGSFYETGKPSDCRGCEACVGSCPVSAISMEADSEGFRYPRVDGSRCIGCRVCERICSGTLAEELLCDPTVQRAFGGAVADAEVLADSTSGGAFTAIATAFLEGGGLVFGAEAHSVTGARHTCVRTLADLAVLRGSKYVQSEVGDAYERVREELLSGQRVLFSGTPCQVAGLRSYLGVLSRTEGLLTVEVVCEGVPSPLFVKKQVKYIAERRLSGRPVTSMRYRDKWNRSSSSSSRWDLEGMSFTAEGWDYQPTSFSSGTRRWVVDRWFNPFWSIWLQHLMSRPSCYACPFARRERIADVTLGDLWGVHLYCPDLYNDDRGASLVVCNTSKGLAAVEEAMPLMSPFRELRMEDALRYQGPMRGTIANNPTRAEFMADLKRLDYQLLVKRYAKRPTLKLIISKYVWGTNRQVCARKTRKERDCEKGSGPKR